MAEYICADFVFANQVSDRRRAAHDFVRRDPSATFFLQ
jgi:hypothetical protein